MKRLLLVLAVVLPLVAAAVWVLGFSSWLSLQSANISITTVSPAAGALDVTQVQAVAELPTGTPLLRVDTGAIAERIESLPQVASATVTRAWPTSLQIDVVRREAVAALATPAGGFDIVDIDDVVIVHVDAAPSQVPLVAASGTGTEAAIAVAAQLPPWLREQTQTITATTRNNVSLSLRGGAVVAWGSAEQPELKAKVLQTLLEVPARYYDVSAPEVPSTSDVVPSIPASFSPTPAPSPAPSASGGPIADDTN